MATRIEKDFNFQAGLYIDEEFHVNSYDITLYMLVETSNIKEQTIAMDRAIHFLYEVFQSSVLVCAKNNEIMKKYNDVGLRICELPEDPYDQVVAMVLTMKLNAIMDNRLKITDMVMGSAMGEGIRFSLESEVAENLLSGNFWWNNSDLSMNNENDINIDHNKIIKLFDDDEWADLGLSWRELAKK